MTPEYFQMQMSRLHDNIQEFKRETGIDFILIGFVPDMLMGVKTGELSPPCLATTATMTDGQVDLIIKSLARGKE